MQQASEYFLFYFYKKSGDSRDASPDCLQRFLAGMLSPLQKRDAPDSIAQLSDPRYLQKISALFYEFEETGANKILGYRNPGELRKNYPKFYWHGVYPYIQNALRYLELTQEGKQIIANLYANVFRVEREPADEKDREKVAA